MADISFSTPAVGVTAMPATLDRAGLKKVRTALDRAGYTRDNVRRALKTDQHVMSQPGEVVVFERRASGRTPLEVLIRLFLIGATVEVADLDTCLPETRADLEGLGLVEQVDGGIRSTVRIAPHGDILLASDRNYYGDVRTGTADTVTGVNNPATLLADLTVRVPADTALDLGTGGGIQALLLSSHCKRVVAVDINPRALHYAELNAGLGGLENIELRQGSWFEPADGESFDIITANPPYVISPDSTFLYRDSGMAAGSLCRQLTRDMPGYLNEGGFGHMLISWALKNDQEWSEPLREWVEGLPCDVWLLHYLTDDPLTHAAKWNGPSPTNLPAYAAAIDRWTGYYRQEGIEQIAFGAIIMRKRSGATNWLRADEVRGGHGSSGRAVVRVFEAEDYLRSLRADSDLLDQRFTIVPEHRLEQRLLSGDGKWQLQEATLSLTEGIAFQGALDIHTAQLLQRFDGASTLRQAARKVSTEFGFTRSETASFTETAMAMAKRLYQLGFLVRTGHGLVPGTFEAP